MVEVSLKDLRKEFPTKSNQAAFKSIINLKGARNEENKAAEPTLKHFEKKGFIVLNNV